MNQHVDLPDPPGPAPLQPDVVAPLPGNPRARNITASAIALLWLILTMVNTTGFVHWTSEQTIDVFAAASIVVAFGGALYAHTLKGTKKEPVALGTFVTLFAPAAIAVIVVFSWVHWTAGQSLSITSVVTGVVGLASLVFVRANATADPTPIT